MTHAVAGRSTNALGSEHRGDIDGLRAVAVAVVVGFHAGIPGLAAGFIGVDVFFVISGFLITGLLLREQEGSGRIDLGRFWARRARRLIPALTVMILVTLVASLWMLSALRWRAAAVDSLWSSLYVSNISFALGTRGYFVESAAPSPFLHTWSLAVEEQFYIVWPLAVSLMLWAAARLRRALRSVLSIAVPALVVLSLALSALLSFRGSRWAYFSLPTRWWEIGFGAAAAILVARWRAGRVAAMALSGAGVAVLVGSMFCISSTTPYPGVAALVPTLGTAALLVAGAGSKAIVHRGLALSPVQSIGRLSYGWYLWHWPAMVLASSYFRSESAWLRSLAGLLALLLAVATARFVERPIRFNPTLVASVRRSLSVSVLAVVAVALVAAGVVALQRRELSDPLLAHLERVVDERRADGSSCFVGGVSSSTGCGGDGPLIVLIGDSHAAHWAEAVGSISARSRLDIPVEVRARGGCPPWGFEVAATGTSEASDACSRFVADTLAYLTGRRPTVVVISTASYHGRVLDASGKVASNEDERTIVRRAVERRLISLKGLGVSVGVIIDNPSVPFEPIDCLGRERAPGRCDFDRDTGLAGVAGMRAIQTAVARDLDVPVFDGAAGMCRGQRCETMIDGRVVYADRTHLTLEFTASEEPALSAFAGRLIGDQP